jgi:uncharacterized membrane protein
MEAMEPLLRWIHVVAGVLWIGHLYFFNFVNASFVATLDAETRRKVVPELMPRALYWFRWGAAWTWVSGLLLLGLVFYHQKSVFENPQPGQTWNPAVFVFAAIAFAQAHPVYDLLAKKVKDGRVLAAVGLVLLGAYYHAAREWGGMGFRGALIHVGTALGTNMAFNVWFRIWPAQRRILAAVKEGTPPDPALVALAGARSRHNTYMSVPLVFTMLNAHVTWFQHPREWALAVVVLAGWGATMLLYRKAAAVKGI